MGLWSDSRWQKSYFAMGTKWSCSGKKWNFSETWFECQVLIVVFQIAGFQMREVKNLPDGTLDMAELREKFRPSNPVDYEPHTSLVCIENTHNYLGGAVLSLEWLDQVKMNFKSNVYQIEWLLFFFNNYVLSPFVIVFV